MYHRLSASIFHGSIVLGQLLLLLFKGGVGGLPLLYAPGLGQ